MPDFGIFRGFNSKLFSDKLFAGQLPTQLGRITYNGLLDFYPNAVAAYSVRKLRGAYTGSAIRVRRSSDNTEQDIGFTVAGDLETSSLTLFCGSGNGFVTTWYDQSGNGNNAVQTTALSQPIIVSGGTVILQNSIPTLQFDGSNSFFSGTITTSGAYTNYAVCYLNNVSGYRGIFTTSQMMLLANTSTNKWGTFGLAEYSANTSIKNLYSIITMLSTAGTSGTFYLNGATDGTFNLSEKQTGALIGGISGQRFSGKIQEIIFWNVNHSSNIAGIQDNNNTYYGIY
jgi:hypothetical protein